MSSLAHTLRRCHSTVRPPMNSWAPISGFVHGLFRRPVRDEGGHGDEVVHGRLLLVLWKWNHCPFGEKEFNSSE